MTTTARELRCTACNVTLPRAGATCHACDVETHFEGMHRTAPPIVTPQRRRSAS